MDSTPIGTIGLHSIDWEARRAEIGYWIAPERHERGYGTEAAELLVGYGFDQLGLHRIAARVFEFNDASRRLLGSVGFTEEGVHRDAEFIDVRKSLTISTAHQNAARSEDGEFQDTHWYGLLEDEWRAE